MTAGQPVLQRMLRPGRATAPGRMTAGRALRLAALRAGQEVAELRFSAAEPAEERIEPEALAAALPDQALILRLDAGEAPPDDAPAGLMAFCPDLVAALIEVQTTGRVSPRGAAARPPTATDAAMAAGFAEGVLLRAAGLARALPDAPPLDGVRPGARIADATRAATLLARGPHRVWRLTLDLAGAARRGTLVLGLAETPRSAPAEDAAGFRDALGRAVLASPAALEAVLARIELPIGALGQLSAGQVLPLGGCGLDDVTLVAADGRRVARARLGRAGDQRAVRLTTLAGTEGARRPAVASEASPAGAEPEPPDGGTPLG
jgi:flagellar motor switch protein FliM